MNASRPIFEPRRLITGPITDCPWANEMVLNPGVIQDPHTQRIHMLFRATGDGQAQGQPADPSWPYPIYLGYACSDDAGQSWTFDTEQPALAPTLATTPDALVMEDAFGRQTPNFANGCIEDPRLFWFEGQCHLIVACRVFPPGAYWRIDDPMQLAPGWAKQPGHQLGRGASDNVTVNLLYRVDLDALSQRQYTQAFQYITHLTDPEFGENRDVLLFPRRLRIQGQSKVACLHRPWEPHHYPGGTRQMKPSIWLSLADSIEQLATPQAEQHLIAEPRFEWENNRIGASAPPIEIEPGRWLISYHGKQDTTVGYTQSMMILEEHPDTVMHIRHRCSDRLLIPHEPWEQPGKFTTPCLFVTAILPQGQSPCQIYYGAGDERLGVAECDLKQLIKHVQRFDDHGRRLTAEVPNLLPATQLEDASRS